MTSWAAARLLRSPGDPRPTTFLELFFDVVFILALAQLSETQLEHLNWRGAFQTLVLLLPLSVNWANVAATTDKYDPRRPSIQLLVFGTMLGTLVMPPRCPRRSANEA